jgi:hypothetical protein
MTLGGTFNGELIGENITLLSNTVVNQTPATVPEPRGTVFVLSLMMAIAVAVGRRKLSRS